MQSPTSMKAGQKSWKWRDAFLRNKTDVLHKALPDLDSQHVDSIKTLKSSLEFIFRRYTDNISD